MKKKKNSIGTVKGTGAKQPMHFTNLQNFMIVSTHPSSSLQRKEKKKEKNLQTAFYFVEGHSLNRNVKPLNDIYFLAYFMACHYFSVNITFPSIQLTVNIIERKQPATESTDKIIHVREQKKKERNGLHTSERRSVL